ncbi:hypothetical protein Tco_0216289 [Tanacetum coccineum]
MLYSAACQILGVLQDSSKVKSPSTSSNSSKSSKSAKDQVVELISVQDPDNAEYDDVELDNTDMPLDQGEDLGNTDEQQSEEVFTNAFSICGEGPIYTLFLLNGMKENQLMTG